MDTLQTTSSMIESLEYDRSTRTLVAHFKGGAAYEYSFVPVEIWEGLQNQQRLKDSGDESASVGKFFVANIRSVNTGIKIS